MKQLVAKSPDEAKKVGETLFLVIERFVDQDKPELLAKVFVAYLDEVISGIEFRRLAQAIDAAFPDDLKELIASEQTPSSHGAWWKEGLVASGLTRVQTRGPTGGGIVYHVTPLGELLRKSISRSLTEGSA
jgi:hypothetical protein